MSDKRYQWSWFPNGDRNEQVVVRSDNHDEFLLDIEQIKKDFGVQEKPDYYGPSSSVSQPLEKEEEYYVREVKKEGPNKGKHFKIGKISGKFLGWTDEPLK